MSKSSSVKVQVFSDIVCPWCFIGKRRWDSVIKELTEVDVELIWRPYQLYPGLPYEGIDRREYLRRRYGDSAVNRSVPRRIEDEAKSVGIELRYDLIRKIPNTAYAHYLLEWSLEFGLQHDLAEALFQAYFCRGVDVGETRSLINICESVGMIPVDVEELLLSVAENVDMSKYLNFAQEQDIFSVPGYLFENGYLLPGAQTEETISQVLRRISEKIKTQ